MGACARNMLSDPAEIKPTQCCIKLVFHLTYTMMHGSTKLKYNLFVATAYFLVTVMNCELSELFLMTLHIQS